MRLTGEMTKAKIRMIQPLSEYFDFFYVVLCGILFISDAFPFSMSTCPESHLGIISPQEIINGFKCALNVLTNPATDPKFMNDMVGNLLDFIRSDKIDKTFIEFVVVSAQKYRMASTWPILTINSIVPQPVILDILPTFVFNRKSVGNEFMELVKKEAVGRKWWECRVSCNDNYNDVVRNDPTPRVSV